jgi:hypothetical protein
MGDDDDDTATLEQQQHAGWRSTYIEHLIFVTELTSQLLMSGFNLNSPANNAVMLVIPVVHDVESAASLFAAAKLCSVVESTLVNVRSLMSNVSPTATPGHMTVTPFGAT